MVDIIKLYTEWTNPVDPSDPISSVSGSWQFPGWLYFLYASICSFALIKRLKSWLTLWVWFVNSVWNYYLGCKLKLSYLNKVLARTNLCAITILARTTLCAITIYRKLFKYIICLLSSFHALISTSSGSPRRQYIGTWYKKKLTHSEFYPTAVFFVTTIY